MGRGESSSQHQSLTECAGSVLQDATRSQVDHEGFDAPLLRMLGCRGELAVKGFLRVLGRRRRWDSEGAACGDRVRR